MSLVRDILGDVDEDGSGTLNFDEFLILMEQYQKEADKEEAARAFFSEHEVEQFRKLFQLYDKDKSGTLTVMELDPLLNKLGKAPKTKQEQKMLTKVLSEIDADRSGTIDFREFLQLLRRFIDEAEYEMVERENSAMKDTGMSKEEVEGYREVFLAFDEAGRGVLGLPEVRRLLRAIGLQLDARHAEELRIIFYELDDDADASTLNFIEFLHLIRKLLDMNFCGIVEKIEKVMSRLEDERRREAKKQELMDKQEKERMKRREQLIKRASRGLKAVNAIRLQHNSSGLKGTRSARFEKNKKVQDNQHEGSASVSLSVTPQSPSNPRSSGSPTAYRKSMSSPAFQPQRSARAAQSAALRMKREMRKVRTAPALSKSVLASEMRAQAIRRFSEMEEREGLTEPDHTGECSATMPDSVFVSLDVMDD